MVRDDNGEMGKSFVEILAFCVMELWNLGEPWIDQEPWYRYLGI